MGVTVSWSGTAHWKMNIQRVSLRSRYQSMEMAAIKMFVGPSNTEGCTDNNLILGKGGISTYF